MTIPSLLLVAPGGQSPGGGMAIFLIQMLLIIAIFYLLIIRPKVKQERQHREKLSQIKRGDEVITAGGIVAEVVHLNDDKITVKSGESRFVVQRDRIAEVRTRGEKAET